MVRLSAEEPLRRVFSEKSDKKIIHRHSENLRLNLPNDLLATKRGYPITGSHL
jgi:hypothetical protein